MILRPDQDPMYVPTFADYPEDLEWKGENPPKLDPPQADWVRDESMLKIALKFRQMGISFAEMLAEVSECAKFPRIPWIALSRGQRQSDELIEKAVHHVEVIDAAVEMFDGQLFLEKDYYCDSIAERVTMRSIHFKNGSVIRGLPANADTARGFTGNIFLDEFAFHRDTRAIKAATIPIISRGYRCRIVSTPNGRENPYYETWTNKDSGYTKHRIDVYEGAHRNIHFVPDPEMLRKAMDDDELFAQEYECAFIDTESVFIPYELILSAESESCLLDLPFEKLSPDSFAGADIGRRRDQTVIWICDKEPEGRRVTKHVAVLKDMPFYKQEEVCHQVAERVGRFAIDETGLGMMLAENLQRKHGSKIIPVTFTMAEKEDMAVRLKRALEDRTFLLPSANFVRSSFRSIKRISGTGGHFRFDADRTEETGHADAFWAAALCERASTLSAIVIAYTPVAHRRSMAGFAGASNQKDERYPPLDIPGMQRRDPFKEF